MPESRYLDRVFSRETHLKPEDLAPSIPGFIFVARQDRDDGYGGCITYIRREMSQRVVERSSHTTERVQLCTVKIRSRRGLLNLSNLYAAPGWLLYDLGWKTNIPGNGILLGDVNATGTWDEDNMHDTARTHDHILEEILHQKGLYVLNDGSSTRSSSNAAVRPSAIDVTAASAQWARLSTWKVDDVPTSDHHSILTIIHETSLHEPPRRRRWSPDKADWEKFRKVLDSQLGTRNTETGSIDRQNSALCSAILHAARKSVPKGNKPKEVPWGNESVATSVDKRRTAWKQFLRDKTPQSRQELHEQQEATARAIRTANMNAWKDTVQEMSACDSITKMWQVMKGMDRSRKPFQPRTLKGFANMSDRKTAESFLQTFISSTKKKGKETTHRNAYRQQMDKAMHLWRQQETDKFKIGELDAAIDSMKVKRAAGPDDIQISFLKQLSANAKDKLLRLYNRSYAEGTTPGAWRRAEMISIEKPVRTHAFRPISLTNVLERCME